MKKLLSVAAMIAASTACANAATILFSLDGFVPAHSTSDSDINVNFALFSGEKTLEDMVTMSSDSNPSTFNTTDFLQKISGKDVSGTTDATGITFTVSSGAITNVRQSSNDPAYTVPTVEGKTYTTDDSMAYFLSTSQSESSNTYAKGTYTVAFGDLYWYGRNDSSYSIDSTSHLGAVQYFTFSLDRDVGANEAVLITFTDSEKAKQSLAGTEKATSGLAVSVSIIPEPSAFGLLAGFGALALAVSRRRRSR